MSQRKSDPVAITAKLSDREIIDFLNNSDAELSEEEEEDAFNEIMKNVEEEMMFCENEIIGELNYEGEGGSEEEENNNNGFEEEAYTVNRNKNNTERNWKWLKKNFQAVDIADNILLPDDNVPENILDAFFEYLNLSFWENTSFVTNLNAFQQQDHKVLNTTAEELIHFTGIHVLMGCLDFPQLQMYWSNEFRVEKIANCMSRHRFCMLRRHLKFTDNENQDGNDKLWKIKPFIEPILNKCQTLPMSYHTAIDEQMIPFSGRCKFRQFMPAKPNPLGLKSFVLASNDGLVLNFQIYTGKGFVAESDMKNLGLGPSIVKLLSSHIKNEGCIYTDRLFTSLKCIEYMASRNLYQVGTVMKNRIGPIIKKLTDDKKMKRGQWEEWVREDDKISLVKWKDNKGVLLLSSYIGAHPVQNCQRWSKESRSKILLPQPAVVNIYNKYMGGVDLCDRYMSLYRCYIRTKKWTIRAFNHFIDLIIVNLWIMHNRNRASEKTKHIPLLNFKIYLAKVLISFSSKAKEASTKRHRLDDNLNHTETNDDNLNLSSVPSKRRTIVIPPVSEERYDGFEHFPMFVEAKNASKCRLEMCSSRTRTICTKCKLYLCTNGNNCFLYFHKKH